MFVGGKRVHHAIDRLARVVRVQRPEHQQTCLRGRKCERDRFQVPHFSDEHDVRILTQGCPERVWKRVGINRHLALRDDAAFVLMHELDRFLNRDDVPRQVFVYVID